MNYGNIRPSTWPTFPLQTESVSTFMQKRKVCRSNGSTVTVLASRRRFVWMLPNYNQSHMGVIKVHYRGLTSTHWQQVHVQQNVSLVQRIPVSTSLPFYHVMHWNMHPSVMHSEPENIYSKTKLNFCSQLSPNVPMVTTIFKICATILFHLQKTPCPLWLTHGRPLTCTYIHTFVTSLSCPIHCCKTDPLV